MSHVLAVMPVTIRGSHFRARVHYAWNDHVRRLVLIWRYLRGERGGEREREIRGFRCRSFVERLREVIGTQVTAAFHARLPHVCMLYVCTVIYAVCARGETRCVSDPTESFSIHRYTPPMFAICVPAFSSSRHRIGKFQICNDILGKWTSSYN